VVGPTEPFPNSGCRFRIYVSNPDIQEIEKYSETHWNLVLRVVTGGYETGVFKVLLFGGELFGH
jgi:hypothetical protein